MMVLPNRFLVKLDTNNDYFKAYHYPLGMVRITVDKAWGFAEEATSKTKKLFSKLTRASPDCYAKVEVGAEAAWKTSTKNNTTTPTWGETHDFVVSDFHQCITVDVEDHDVGSDDQVGIGITTVRDIILAGGKQELALVRKGEETDGKVAISAEFFHFAADGGSFSASAHAGDGRLCGLATVLVAGALGIKGAREQLGPSVVVSWGDKHKFQTAVKADAAGTDINNPTWDQGFRIPLTSDVVGAKASFRIALMDKKNELGFVEVPYEKVLKAPDMILQDKFDVGGGATVRASICLRGVQVASKEEVDLPQRGK
jgi:Ca2+-dependent lipid-binding protein